MNSNELVTRSVRTCHGQGTESGVKTEIVGEVADKRTRGEPGIIVVKNVIKLTNATTMRQPKAASAIIRR